MAKAKKWTSEEIDILIREYPRANLEELSQRLGRSTNSLIRKAMSFPDLKRDKSFTYSAKVRKPRKDDWSPEEVAKLKDMYWRATNEELVVHFGRTIEAIKTKAIKEKFPRDIDLAYQRREHVRDDGWSSEEHAYLVRIYPEVEFSEELFAKFQEKYPKRTSSAIYSRCKVFKLSSLRSSPLKSSTDWSNEEIASLLDNYDNLYWGHLEEKVGRPKRAMQEMIHRLGLKRPKELFWREGMWSKDELKDLYKMWPESHISDIFDRFPDRPYQSIKKKAYEAGITRLIKNSTSEILMKRLLDEIFPGEEVLDNKRYDWLRSTITGAKMELDRYYPKLKLAFEYDGEQHYCSKAFYRIAQTRGQEVSKEDSLEEWKTYIENDKIKRELCEKLNIKLITIRYDEELTPELIYAKIEEI